MKKTTLAIFCLSLFSINIIAQSSAIYDITFTSVWNSGDHGTLPLNAHWSDLVGANHNSSITFLEMGATASPGIEDVAELGANGVFYSEVQSQINAGNAEQWFQEVVDPFGAIASATLSDITVSEDFPLITLASMIAPSPDWMIAVNSLNLWDESENKWKTSFSIDLFPYDAGTEEGFGYSGNNPATNPRGVITNIAGASGYPFNNEKIGTLTVTLKSSTLSTETFERNKSITIYPNPSSTGNVTITSATQINRIDFYDVLGKNVKSIVSSNITEENLNIDVKALNSGIYILRIINNSGIIENKKLIIK